MSTTGKPASTPFFMASWMPLSAAVMYSLGTTPPTIAFSNYVTGATFLRLHLDHDMAVLAATTGLAHELAFLLDRFADRFAVGNLRLADVGFDVELALHAVNEDFQVQLAHAGNDGLAGFFVGTHAEGRIFLRQTAQARYPFFPGQPWSSAQPPSK